MAVEAIFVNGGAKARPMTGVDRARAVAGKGLEGNRYFGDEGDPDARLGPDRQVTLIEAEAVEAVRAEAGLALEPGETRRNIVTRGVALNHLVGREFLVGDARLRGIRLCEPCKHLEALTRPGILAALVHRGGLRAQVIGSGTIRVGDAVATLPETAPAGDPA